MTDAQKKVLDAIRELGSDGWPVTVREIMRVAGYASPSTVQVHLAGLERAGLIERSPRGSFGVRATA